MVMDRLRHYDSSVMSEEKRKEINAELNQERYTLFNRFEQETQNFVHP